jgi:transcriptional regulator with GAF, ATPase, and Fis domain
VRIADPWMSSTHAKLFFAAGQWNVQDAKSRNGTVLNGKPISAAALADGDLLEAGHTFFFFRFDEESVDETAGEGAAPGLSTLLPSLQAELAHVPGLARSTVSVVIQAESGTGKELLARAIHALSERTGAFVPVNCGAIPENLVETELFGYRKGAFSGANEDRPGLVRSADKGTLFLDEIGDLPPASQAAFLRVLQEREVVPVGATRAVPVDLRVIAASHRDLEALADKGAFRGDLLARISGYTLELPPLRDRRCDLGLLIAALLRRIAPRDAEKVTFGTHAARACFRYTWPRNIRELEKTLERAFVLAKGGAIDVAHLPDAVRGALTMPPPAPPVPVEEDEDEADELGGGTPLSDADRERRARLVQLLKDYSGNVSAVARVMGKGRTQIQRWIKRYAIDPGR